MATDRDFLEWLAQSGCGIYRDGCYDVSTDELWIAYVAHKDGNLQALEELDAIRLLAMHYDEYDGEMLLTDEQLALVEKMLEDGTVWGYVPRRLRALAARTKRDIQYRESYEFRREMASIHIADPAVRKRIFERDGYQCRRCQTNSNLSIDHIVPVFHGGGNEDGNLQTLCRRCNSAKGARQ